MIQTFKIVNNIDMDNGEILVERADTRRPTRNYGGRDNLIVKRSQHEYRKNFFSIRVVGDWNSLPDMLKEAGTVSCFKRLYRRHIAGTVAPADGDGQR